MTEAKKKKPVVGQIGDAVTKLYVMFAIAP